jgi:Uri superfamily endonuclease
MIVQSMGTSESAANVILPKAPGTYAIVLQLDASRVIRVGRLGDFNFPAGYYLYLGSALGPGGLAGRLGRHLAQDKSESRPHWHIDYLRWEASVQAVWYITSANRREHDWAELAAMLDGASTPAPRFGASDCRCPSHLFHFATPPDHQAFARLLQQQHPADPPLQIM